MIIDANHPVRQVAYFVPDAAEAARQHARLFGSGPFFLAQHIPLTHCEYRGKPAELDHTSAYGQWGEVMIEFVQQHNPGPSVFRDLYPEGQGFHHVALIVHDLSATRQRFESRGFATGFYGEVAPGAGFAMMDCVSAYGHFVELYEPSPALLGVYETVKNAAGNYDAGVVRSFQLL